MEVGLVQRVRPIGALDAVHRDVRVADQVLGARHAGGADCDADAHVTRDLAAPERIRSANRLEQTLRGSDRSLRANPAHEYGELVAADPRCEIADANRPTETAGLEAVEIEVEHGSQAAVSVELLLDLLQQMAAVRQAGERVVVCLVAELLLELGHLRERMLEPAVLEQDARMTGEGLEKLQIGVAERTDVPDPLADDE